MVACEEVGVLGDGGDPFVYFFVFPARRRQSAGPRSRVAAPAGDPSVERMSTHGLACHPPAGLCARMRQPAGIIRHDGGRRSSSASRAVARACVPDSVTLPGRRTPSPSLA